MKDPNNINVQNLFILKSVQNLFILSPFLPSQQHKSVSVFAPALVKAFLSLQRPDLADEVLPLVKDAEAQASLLIKMGRRDEAEAILEKAAREGGGGLLGWFKG